MENLCKSSNLSCTVCKYHSLRQINCLNHSLQDTLPYFIIDEDLLGNSGKNLFNLYKSHILNCMVNKFTTMHRILMYQSDIASRMYYPIQIESQSPSIQYKNQVYLNILCNQVNILDINCHFVLYIQVNINLSTNYLKRSSLYYFTCKLDIDQFDCQSRTHMVMYIACIKKFYYLEITRMNIIKNMQLLLNRDRLSSRHKRDTLGDCHFCMFYILDRIASIDLIRSRINPKGTNYSIFTNIESFNYSTSYRISTSLDYQLDKISTDNCRGKINSNLLLVCRQDNHHQSK